MKALESEDLCSHKIVNASLSSFNIVLELGDEENSLANGPKKVCSALSSKTSPLCCRDWLGPKSPFLCLESGFLLPGFLFLLADFTTLQHVGELTKNGLGKEEEVEQSITL